MDVADVSVCAKSRTDNASWTVATPPLSRHRIRLTIETTWPAGDDQGERRIRNPNHDALETSVNFMFLVRLKLQFL
jgi:hypothetical protein